MKKKLVLLALLLASPLSVSAVTYSGILLTLSPENPGPYDRVTVSASYLGANAGTNYVWTVDGEVQVAGAGRSSIVIDAPPLGIAREISVAVIDGDRILATESVTIDPAEVVIEWSGDGLLPPFYSGKPLLTAHGKITAVAIANIEGSGGARVPNRDVLYTWKLNGKILKNSGGYGQNVVEVRPPFFNDAFTVSVTATSRDGRIRAEDRVVIAPRVADLVVYETTPLDGIVDYHAVGADYEFSESEVSFFAFPMHVSSLTPPRVEWKLGGEPITAETGDPRLAIFKKTGAGTGQFMVGAEYLNQIGFLDQASKSFLLHF